MASAPAVPPENHVSVRGRVPPRALGALAACSFVLAWLVLLPAQTRRLDAGRPGDAVWFAGASDPTMHRGARGRWTRGDGRVRLGLSGLPAVVRMRVASGDAGAPATLQTLVDGSFVGDSRLDFDWTDVEVTIGTGGNGELSLRSAVTSSPDGQVRGVFVDWIDVQTGGIRSGAIATAVWLGLAILSLLVAATLAQPLAVPAVGSSRPGPAAVLREWWLPVATAAAVVVFAMIFRDEVLRHVRVLTAIACGFAACTWTAIVVRDGAATRRWLAPVLFSAASMLLVGGLFSDAWLRGRVLSQADMLYDHTPWQEHRPADWRPLPRAPFGDVPMFVYPFHVVAVERMRAFELPLWTTGVGAGLPVLANYQSALLSPFTWLLLVVPLPGATVVLAASRLLVGGAGMFCFLRRIGLSGWASGIGGLAYLLSPVTIVWLEHPLANVSPWLPWMLLAADRAVEGGLARMGVLALVTALTFVGGHPHLALYITALGAAYAVAAAIARRRPLARIGRALCAIGVGGSIAALQILPFLEYAGQSRTIEMRSGYALNPFVAPLGVLMTALLPDAFGHPGYANYAGPLNYLEQLNYAGVSVLLLAIVGLASAGRSWRPWFFAAVIVCGGLAMYGAPGVHHLISALPLVRVASLVRLAFLVAAAAAILAAFGADALARPLERAARTRISYLSCGAVLAIGLTLIVFVEGQRSFLARNALSGFVMEAAVACLMIAVATASVILLRVRQGLPGRVTAVAMGAIVAAELFVFARGFHPLIDPAAVFPVTPELARLQEDKGIHRVVAAGGGLLPNSALVFGLQDPRSYDGIGVKPYGELLDSAFHWGDSFHAALRFESPLFDLLNVQYILGPPGMTLPADRFTRIDGLAASLHRNERALPRAFLVDRYRVETGNTARRLLRDGGIDYRREVLLEADPAIDDRPDPAPESSTPGDARIRRYRNERVEVETDAPGRRLLVLTDTWFPGWKAMLDGNDVRILRANVAFRAVAVPPGRHVVTFEYRPASVRAGAWISCVAAAIVGLLLVSGLLRPFQAGEAGNG
jgi:hypothetical protein